MLRRVTRHTTGLKEHELRKIVEATIFSRVLYALPYLKLTKTQNNKLEIAIRKCLRTELGVPMYAPNYLLDDTALHNTLEEKVAAHIAAQQHRLTTSTQGRTILADIGFATSHLPPLPKEPPPWDTIPRIMVKPIPRHMDPSSDSGRRRSRALHLSSPSHDTYYTDATFTDNMATTVTVGPREETIRQHCNVPSSTAAEIQAIADSIMLQTHSTDQITIRTDSQSALREFATNSLPAHIHHELTCYMAAHSHLHVFLEWVPGHQGIVGNERAHALARANRNPSDPQPWPQDYSPKEERAAHRKARRQQLKDLRRSRRNLPPPTSDLTRREGTYIRQAQTLSLPCDLVLHYIMTRDGTPHCQVCGAYPDVKHTYWTCPRARRSPHFLHPHLLPSHIPYSWENWAAPPPDLRPILWPRLARHIAHVRGPDTCGIPT